MKPKEKVFFEVKSVSASVTEREQKALGRVDEQVNPKENRGLLSDWSRRANETERESFFRSEERKSECN